MQRPAQVSQQAAAPQSQRVTPAAPKPSAVEEERSDSDWGLAPTKPAFSRENKFILFVLLVLVAVFSFVVFRNFQKKQGGAKGEEVATKDNKKSDAKAPQKLDESTDADNQGATTTLAESETLSEDPFATGETLEPTTAEPPSQDLGQMAEAGELVDDTEVVSSAIAEVDDSGPPPQLQAATDPPAQATEFFEAGNEQPVEVSQEPVEVNMSRGARRAGRGIHSQPAQIEDIDAQAAEFNQVETGAAEFEAGSAADPFGPSELAQVGGTSAAEPIQKRASQPASGVEPVPAAPPETAEPATQTMPRATAPRGTAPRTTAPRTVPRVAAQPRDVPSPPPPLDPADERLGGFREGELVPSDSTPRTAGRSPAAMPPGQFDPQSEPLIANSGEYVVRPNDNYWRISRKVYGTARYFAALAKHNELNVPDAKHMKPGIKIATPPKELLEQHYGDLLPVVAPSRPMGAVIDHPHAPRTPGYFMETDGQPAYRIGPSDTLSSISHKTLGRSSRWDEIFELNRDRLAGADTLTVGTILRLPPDASQTRLVGKPIENR